jgi:hypothetical protein
VAHKRELRLKIVLRGAPSGVDFALQKGHGSDFAPVQVQRSAAQELTFECRVVLRGDARNPKLGGPFVHGPAGGKFLYLDSGAFAGQKDSCWNRRLKIPLSGISPTLLKRAMAGNAPGLATQIPGTAKDGGPNCGTVKPFEGWKVRAS